MQKITPGRIVLYTLSESDANEINRRRTTGPEIAQRIPLERWPLGAQAHIGTDVHAGDVLPAIVVKVHTNVTLPDDVNRPVNLKVQLDGTDTFWATVKDESELPTPGHWHWPPRA